MKPKKRIFAGEYNQTSILGLAEIVTNLSIVFKRHEES
jgi:hypothetical protein